MSDTAYPILSDKDPDDKKFYYIDPANMIPGVSLTGAEVVLKAPSDITATASVVSTTSGPVAQITTTGGTVDTDYAITVRLTFSDTQTRDRTVTIPCRAK